MESDLGKLENLINANPALTRFLHSLTTSLPDIAGAYLVGGIIRDSLLDIPGSKDYDVMVEHMNESGLEQILRELKRNQSLLHWQKVGRSFPVFKIHLSRNEPDLDLALARTETSTGFGHRDFAIEAEGISAREDGLRRDFTVNALYGRILPDLESGLRLKLVDYFGGFDDLAEGRLRAVGNALQRFEEDPLRILRALRFQIQLNLTPDKDILQTIESHGARLLPHLSKDRIQDEILRMSVKSPRAALLSLGSHRIFEICLPELLPYLVDPVADWLPQSKQVSREIAAAFLFLPWLLRLDGQAEVKLRTLEQVLVAAHIPNPRNIRGILAGVSGLLRLGQCAYPLALQEKLLLSPYSSSIQIVMQHLIDQGLCKALENLPVVAEPRITGSDLMSWGFKAGPGFEDLLLTARQKQLEGQKIGAIQEFLASIV